MYLFCKVFDFLPSQRVLVADMRILKIMEKNFTNAILLSGTVLAAFMIIYPPIHISAQNTNTLDEDIKVRKVIVESVDFRNNTLVVHPEDDDDFSIRVATNASTTFFFGNGEETELPAIRPGAGIYLFGTYDREDEEIDAEKIVVRNKRITERTGPSRSDMARTNLRQGYSPNTPDFNLTATLNAR